MAIDKWAYRPRWEGVEEQLVSHPTLNQSHRLEGRDAKAKPLAAPGGTTRRDLDFDEGGRHASEVLRGHVMGRRHAGFRVPGIRQDSNLRPWLPKQLPEQSSATCDPNAPDQRFPTNSEQTASAGSSVTNTRYRRGNRFRQSRKDSTPPLPNLQHTCTRIPMRFVRTCVIGSLLAVGLAVLPSAAPAADGGDAVMPPSFIAAPFTLQGASSAAPAASVAAGAPFTVSAFLSKVALP